MAFAYAFEMTFQSNRDMTNILIKNISMLMCSRSLLDLLTKFSSSRLKRLMIDLKAVKDALQSFKKLFEGFIRSEHKAAINFSKLKNHSVLMSALN